MARRGPMNGQLYVKNIQTPLFYYMEILWFTIIMCGTDTLTHNKNPEKLISNCHSGRWALFVARSSIEGELVIFHSVKFHFLRNLRPALTLISSFVCKIGIIFPCFPFLNKTVGFCNFLLPLLQHPALTLHVLRTIFLHSFIHELA